VPQVDDIARLIEEARQGLVAERTKLKETISEAHAVAQELSQAVRAANEAIRNCAKEEARKQLAKQLGSIAEQLRVKA
jgi:hypothetical protein